MKAIVIVLISCLGMMGLLFELRPLLVVRREPPPMPLSEMTARAALITGRLMTCFGDPGSAQCRPVELQQTGNLTSIVRPVVVCFERECRLVATEPVR